MKEMNFVIWQGKSTSMWFVQRGRNLNIHTSILYTKQKRWIRPKSIEDKHKFDTKEEALQALYDWAKTLTDEDFAEFTACRMNGGIVVQS